MELPDTVNLSEKLRKRAFSYIHLKDATIIQIIFLFVNPLLYALNLSLTIYLVSFTEQMYFSLMDMHFAFKCILTLPERQC